MQTYKRYARSIPLYGLLALCFILTACDSGTTTATKAPDAQQLLNKAQTAIQQVKAYHFNLTTDNPGTGSGINIKGADGDIVSPDKLQANATALALGATIQVKIVAIGDQEYMTDPLSGNWQKTSNLIDPRSIADPQSGVSAILGHVQNPSTPVDSNVDGTSCWSIDGKLDTMYLSGITGGGTPTGSAVATTICIGKSDNRPYQVRVTGVAAEGDSTKTIRTFKLSKFDESITITAPTIH